MDLSNRCAWPPGTRRDFPSVSGTWRSSQASTATRASRARTPVVDALSSRCDARIDLVRPVGSELVAVVRARRLRTTGSLGSRATAADGSQEERTSRASPTAKRLTDALQPLKHVRVNGRECFRPLRIGALSLLWLWGALSCQQPGSTPTLHSQPTQPAAAATAPEKVTELAHIRSGRATLEPLEARLGELAIKAGGRVGISVIHVESGRSVTVAGQEWLPLQSVFKLPLAVAVLRDVQAGQVSLDQMLTVRAEDRAPGVAMNEKKWTQVPRTVSVRQLLEYSLVDSDNTASDKLLDLMEGLRLTGRMQALGFQGIAVRAPTKAMGASGELPNEATAEALARLLAALARGEILEASQRALLWEIMGRARTGERRIRAGLPAGTPVLDKTGTGGNGSVTNDVGLVTLPGNAGHLAIAVLIAASSLPARAQEDLIAEIARTAFNSFVGSP